MHKPDILFANAGGHVRLPSTPLNDRADGGHLLVNPPREVWERTALTPRELIDWTFLVAATADAMLATLPQLDDGCINYWEAGNWALNRAAAPAGSKSPRQHRKMHLHLLGRSRNATHPDWQWGESPRFPPFTDYKAWSAQFSPLTADECGAIKVRIEMLLATKYLLPVCE